MRDGNNTNSMSESNIIYADLSYEIIGAAFAVCNELAFGLPEKDYQRALAEEFKKRTLSFQREVYIPLQYKSSALSRYFADFIVEKKILLELKVVSKLGYIQARQTLTYLQVAGIKLGILIYFTPDGVKYRRILNPRS